METIKELKRVPVVYKGKPLMPTTQGRAYHLVKLGKGVFVKDKHLGWYLKLKVKPSGFYKQKLALGIDTGTMFLGFSVVGKDISTNVEFEQTQKKLNRNYIKIHSELKRENRRIKRSRLCHRESRFSNRTGHKVNFTSNYIFQNIHNCVNWLFKLYPITDIVVEDIRFNYYISTKGSGFSPIEQIKTRLYGFLRTKGNLIISNNNPKALRRFTDLETGDYIDLKEKNKAKKSFYSHCIDSHSLTQLVFNKKLPFSEEIKYIYRAQPGIDSNRRKLERFMSVRGSKERRPSKLKKLRVKINDSKSNHGEWVYMYTKPEVTKSQKRYCYGSSIYKSNQHGNVLGRHKYKFDKNFKRYYPKGFYRYYGIQIIKISKVSPTISYCNG